MSDHENRLRRLLDDAVSDVEPRPGLDAIRSRTGETTLSVRRPWLLATGGAAVATAATIAAVAIIGNTGEDPTPGPAETPTASASPTQATEPTGSASPEPTPTETSGPAPETRAVVVYYLGDTPHGPRLYREFHRLEATDHTLAAVREAMEPALDPDYRSMWPDDVAVDDVRVEGADADDLIRITLSEAPSRPAGMTEAEAAMSVEQLIYTAQGAVQSRAPVQFMVDDNPVAEVLGVPTSEPLANGPQIDTLALVSITAPAEGATVSGTFEASGVASSVEATVPWEIRRGDEVVAYGFFTAEGWTDRLYPFSDPVDVSGLAPGEYTFAAMTSDPSGGAEGAGPHVDTRTITVE